MNFRIKHWIPLCIAGILAMPVCQAQNPDNKWDEAQHVNANFKAVSALSDIEVFSAPNIIMMKVNKPTEVRLFTILGKLISSQHLEPGSYQYHMETHGIYLIKTEQSSCKVAI